MAKRPRVSSEAARVERVVRARTAGRSIQRIAADERISENAVNDVLDHWVAGLIGPQLREREYALLLARNDELIEALRPRALEAKSKAFVAAYQAAMSRRATLLALRPPQETVVRVFAESTPKPQSSTQRIEAALAQLVASESPVARAEWLRRELRMIEHQPADDEANTPTPTNGRATQ